MSLLSPSMRLVDESLHLLTALSDALVPDAGGVTVTLERRGRLTTVAATDELVDVVDRAQYDIRQGPCVSATAEGRQHHAPSLATESRWPRFTPYALDAGFASIMSTPLLVGDAAVGALNIYSRRENVFGAPELQLARLLASHGAAFLARVDSEPPDEVDLALRSREIIAQGQGVLMERRGAGADEAYATMRDAARRDESTLREQALALVLSTRRRRPHDDRERT